ncbi:hypothetical protein [Dethiobacter alkaliphilus]|uniref:hypothetical protein n=1 Tax=Dethiobacter alkaliphilus TaxID=427926 RepID=UPI0003070C28|nr:hypothetical protein [Dethiobacter alkaliphilus]
MQKSGILVGILLVVLLLFMVAGCRNGVDETVVEEPVSSGESGTAEERSVRNGQKEASVPDQPDDEVVVEMVIQAHAVALDIFFSAFEDGFLGVEPTPFDEVRPTLIEHYSERLVDKEFKQFYEESLWAWGYEMHFAFPFFDRENIIDLDVKKREDTRIVVRGTAYVNYEEHDTITQHLIYENSRWVLD